MLNSVLKNYTYVVNDKKTYKRNFVSFNFIFKFKFYKTIVLKNIHERF